MSCFLCLTHPVALCAPPHSCALLTYLSPTHLCHFISFPHLSKPCIFSNPFFTQTSVSSSPPTCSLLLCFFCINLELHEITYHQRLSQALSFREGTLSIHSSWKLRKMPDITIVRCDSNSGKLLLTSFLSCLSFTFRLVCLPGIFFYFIHSHVVLFITPSVSFLLLFPVF